MGLMRKILRGIDREVLKATKATQAMGKVLFLANRESFTKTNYTVRRL
jgi:hypothetical protein